MRVVNVRKLRTPTQRMTCVYVGRRFAGWPASQWGNPFRLGDAGCETVDGCLNKFLEYAMSQPKEWIESLWEACEHGEKPIGCWCVDDDGANQLPLVCHAQVLRNIMQKLFAEQVPA